MKLFKRLAAMALALTMSMSFAVITNAAEGTFKFSAGVDKTAVKAGDEFTLTVNVDSNPGIYGCLYTITYDNTKYYPVSYEKGASFNQGSILCGLLDQTEREPDKENKLTMMYYNSNPNENITTTGVFTKVKFKTVEDIDGAIDIKVEPSQSDIINVNGQQVTAEGDTATVNIVNLKGLGDADGDGFITSNDAAKVYAAASKGETIDKADVDGNGKVEPADASEILNKVLRASYKFTVEKQLA